MSKADLARYRDLTDEASDLTPLFLGALKLLDDFATAATRSADDRRRGETNGDFDEGLLLAALGLLSLRRTVHRWASHAADQRLATPERSGERISLSPMLR